MSNDDIPTAASLSVGDTGPELEFEDVDRKDIVKYAGASGDFNPIHYDEQFAGMAGYDDVFAQGMLTAGFAAQAVEHWFGIRAIDSFGVRFESQVWPGDTVTAVATVVDVEERGESATTGDADEETVENATGENTIEETAETATVETAIEVTNEAGELVLSGEATASVSAE